MYLGAPKRLGIARHRLLALSAVLSAFAPGMPNLWGQSGTLTAISGVLTDSTGAAVPRATVTATFISTHAVRTTQTGDDGSFSFLQLGSGEYDLSTAAPGFAPLEELVSYVGIPVRLSLHLAPEGNRSEVTVTAKSEGLDPTAPARVNVTLEEISRIPSQSVSSPLSSLITNTTPGVSADSNGSFHPLGDHAEASFVIDGQPITDQQSRTFSSQISLNALQSLEVREGAPQADVGDKTSMVIIGQTRSGLDRRRPSGELSLSRGGFSTSQASAHLGYGTERFGRSQQSMP